MAKKATPRTNCAEGGLNIDDKKFQNGEVLPKNAININKPLTMAEGMHKTKLCSVFFSLSC